jgi:hypothetical protein
MCDIRDCRTLGLCPSSGVLKNTTFPKLDVSVLGWGAGWHLHLFGPLENANISHYISRTLLALFNRLFFFLKIHRVSVTRLFVYFYRHGRTQSQGSAWRSWSPSLGVGYEAQCHISRLLRLSLCGSFAFTNLQQWKTTALSFVAESIKQLSPFSWYHSGLRVSELWNR